MKKARTSFDPSQVDLGRHTASGGATAIIAQAIRVLVQLAGMAVLARLLSPSDFGLVAMATTVVSFVSIFSDLGLSVATVQRKEIDQATTSTLFYVNIAMGLALAVVCIAAAPILARAFGDPRVSSVAIALGLSIPVSAAGTQHGALLQRSMRWAPLQWTPIIAQTTGAIVAILFAWQTTAGYWALVAQLWVTSTVATVLLWRFSHWRPDLVFRLGHSASSLHFGFNLAGSYFLNYFHRQFDKLLVGQSWGAASLGYYARAYQLLLLPNTLVEGPIASVVIPALSRVQHDPPRWRSAFLRAFVSVNLFASAISTVLVASAEPLVRVVYGAQWNDAEPIFLFLSISMFAATPFNALSWAYVSLGQSNRMLRWGLFVTPFFLLSFIVGLPYGPKGVALSYSIAMCLVVVPGIAFMTRHAPVGFWECLVRWLPTAIVGGASAWGARLIAASWTPGNGLLDLIERSSVAIALYLIGVGALLALGVTPLSDLINEPIFRRLIGRAASDTHLSKYSFHKGRES